MMKKYFFSLSFVFTLLSCCMDKVSFAQTYCIPSGVGSTWSILDFSTTGGTTNITNLANGYSTNGYGDFTTMIVTVDQGNSFTISAAAGALASFTYKWAVWVDWNNDGDFDDPGETVYSYLLTNGINTMTATITVPATATVGNKRLRIRDLRDYQTQALVPCGNLPGGETEDYTLAVTSGVPVTCAAPTVPTATGITATTASLNWTQTGTPPQWEIKYGPTGFNVNTGGTSVFTTTKPYTLNPPLIPATTYDYYVRAVCGTNDTSLWSPVVTFTTLAVPITCPAPTAATATSITTTTASLNWTQSSTPSQWQIKYGPTGFNVNTGGTSIYTATKPYTLNPPLTPATTYDYYVRAVCAANDTSFWTPVTTFTTVCVGETVTSFKDSFVCGSGQAILEATASGSAVIKWYAAATGGTALFTGNTYTTPNITANTTYYVSAVSGTCESTPRQAVQAVVRPMPIVNIGNDTSICPGMSHTLNATVAGATYLWSYNGTTSPSITINQAGVFSVEVTLNKCSKRDTIIITLGIVPTNSLPAILDICDGNTAVLNAGNTGATYLWTPGAETTQTKTISSAGTQLVTIKSADGCAVNGTTDVFMRPNPIPNLISDTSICESSAITLDAGNIGYSYLWNTNDITQTIQVADSGTYSVSTTSPYGCELEETVHIAFLPSPRTEGFNFIPFFNNQLGRVKFIPLNPTDVSSVSWDFGDGSAISSVFSPEHLYAAAGYYEVKLTVYNDCNHNTISQVINVEFDGVGVADAELIANMKVYPNPVKSLLNISSQNKALTIERVVMVNVLGAKVLEKETGKQVNAVTTIDVNNLSTGIYFLQINTNQGIINKKIEILR